MTGAVESQGRLRPLGVGELLDAAIKVCTSHAGTLLRAVFVVILPVQILSAVILASTVDDPDILNITTLEAGATPSAEFWAGQIAVALLSGASFLLATGACFHAIAESWLGRKPDWRASLRFALRRALPLLWVSILYTLAVIGGLIACIVPGIWLGIAFSIAYPVLFVEDVRGAKALGRSNELVKGRWWPSFGVVAIGFVLAGIASTIFTYGVGALALVNDSLGFLILLTTLGTLIAGVLTTPFQAAIITVLYFDLRVRKEGFDLELLADRLAGGAPLGRPDQARPFATPAGASEWGAPHPAAPYWPPPPGWTPPEDAGGWETPAPAGGWTPPSRANRAAEDAFGRPEEPRPDDPPPPDEPEEPPRWIPPGSGT